MYDDDAGVSCPREPTHDEPEHAGELANRDPYVEEDNSGRGISAGIILFVDTNDGKVEGE